MRYRDSYGRIYNITRQLDSMQPEQVFLSTLDVMEDTLQNQSVAIYIHQNNSAFARLLVHSRAIKDLPRSLNMNTLPKLKACMDEGKLFSNTALEPGYPAFASPLSGDNGQVAFIALWDVPFDKQTLYFRNLLSVVSGLVQSAMVRAFNFVSMADDIYVPDTHILADHAFRSALGVYQNMRRRRMGNYLLVRVKSETALPSEEYDRRIARVARSTDVVGLLSSGDYCVLFPQAGVENLPQISARFSTLGLACEIVAQEAAYA